MLDLEVAQMAISMGGRSTQRVARCSTTSTNKEE